MKGGWMEGEGGGEGGGVGGMTRSITAIVVSDMLARCPGVGEERIKIQSVYAPVQRGGGGGWGGGGKFPLRNTKYKPEAENS